MKKPSLIQKLILTSLQKSLSAAITLLPSLGFAWATKVFMKTRPVGVRKKEQEILDRAEKKILSINDHSIWQYTWGSGSKIALLVHGWNGQAGNFAAIINRLLENDFTVISFDNPAHGKSSGTHTTMIQVAGVLKELILQMPQKPDIVAGHSFGSGVTIVALSQLPHIHFPAVLLLSTPNRLRDIFADFWRFMALPKSHFDSFITYLAQRFNVDVEEFVIGKIANKVNTEHKIIFHDEHDRILPFSYATEATSLWKGSQLFTLHKAGHYRMLWHEELLSKVEEIALNLPDRNKANPVHKEQ